MLRSLDLFSGIGGMALAFEGFAEPQAYCEINSACQTILENTFAAGRLPRAPVFGDVAALSPISLALGEIDIVVGGFPCVGFSVAGKRHGLLNPQSNLFYQMLRVVDECDRPPFVFMENVPGVLRMGMRDVASEFSERGYDLRWCVVPAYAVGAPHVRRRWFCLATRRDCHIRQRGRKSIIVASRRHAPFVDWDQPPQKMCDAPPGCCSFRRIELLGNAVVPDACRLAFVLLFSGFTKNTIDPEVLEFLPVTIPPNNKVTTKAAWPACGAVVDGETYQLPAPVFRPKPDLGIWLDPAAFSDPGGKGRRNCIKRDVLTSPVHLRLWATPRYSCASISTVLTSRSRDDLSTQLRFARDTPDDERGKKVSVEFVEWLMGFPRGHSYYTHRGSK
jgi:DNA (cytosine-5)-methyltransferase 1